MISKQDILTGIEDLKAKAEEARTQFSSDVEEIEKAYKDLGEAIDKIREPADNPPEGTGEPEPGTAAPPDPASVPTAGPRGVAMKY
jgi:hypothetical protein